MTVSLNPSYRFAVKVKAANARLARVLDHWLCEAGADAPVEPEVMRHAARLVGDIRRLVSRTPAFADVPALPTTPLPPGALHARLCGARAALRAGLDLELEDLSPWRRRVR